jgi:NADH-quinone oxidoreductase subunit K
MEQEIPSLYLIVLSSLLFSIGLAIVLTKKNIILILMGIEIMLNAANINFVFFSQQDSELIQGQMMTLLVLVIAASEASVALAIIIKAYQYFGTLDLGKIKNLRG